MKKRLVSLLLTLALLVLPVVSAGAGADRLLPECQHQFLSA